MRSLAIIGGNGMLGSDLVKYLGNKYKVTSIDKKNYKANIGKHFDVLINANGNSRRYWANENSHLDFVASTLSVHKSIFDFPCNLYIYISSIDIYGGMSSPKSARENLGINTEKLTPYGFHKYLSELIVKKYIKKFIILRPSYILGSKLKKGPIFDLMNKKPLFITLRSRFQLISTKAVGEVIDRLIDRKFANITLNIGGIGVFDFKNAKKYFDYKIPKHKNGEKQVYEMNINNVKKIYPELKESEVYLQEFLAKGGLSK